MRNVLFILISALSICSVGCQKENLRKGKGEAFTSYGEKLEFNYVSFGYENNGLLTFQFDHQTEGTNIVLSFSFANIEPVEGISSLVNNSVNIGSSIRLPTSSLYFLEGGDVQGESYGIDSTSVLESILNITSISENKIEGEFQASYIISRPTSLKAAPWIPDQFSVTDVTFKSKN